MATREELVQALAAADAANNTEDAQFLADQIRAMDAAKAAPVDVGAQAKAEYDQMGILDQITTALGDVAYSASNAPYLGHRDKIMAGAKSLFGDRSYEEELADQRKLSQAVRGRAGSADLAAEMVGGMATGSAANKAGMSLLGDISNMPFWQRLAASMGAGGLEGATYGGLSAAGEDQDIGSGIRSGGAIGMGAGGISEAVLSALGKITTPAAAAPTARQLADEVDQGYKQLDREGAEISGDAIGRLNQRIQRNVVNQPGGPRRQSNDTKAIFGEIDALLDSTPSMQPAKETARRVQSTSDGTTRTTTSVNGRAPRTREVDRVATGDTESTRRVTNMMPDRGMSLYDLEEHRKAIRDATRSNPVERKFGGQTNREIDAFNNSLTPDDVTVRSGKDITDVVRELNETRGTAHREEKLGEISGIRRAAEIESKKPGAGTQGDKIRSKVGDFIKKEDNLNGYSPDERQALNDILEGKGGAKAMEKIQNALGGFGAFTAATGIGGAVGSFLGGIPGGAVGAMTGPSLAKGLSIAAGRRGSTVTNKAIDRLEKDIARGYKSRATTKNGVKASDTEALRRALTILGLENPGSN